MPSDISRELEQLKRDSDNKIPVIKSQDWKKSQWHGWANQVNQNTAIEYKSALQPAGDKKDRGQNAKKKPHVYSNHWDQDPRDPDYVEEEEVEEEEEIQKEKSGRKMARKDESESSDDEYMQEKKKKGGKKVATRKHTTRSGGKRA